MKMRETRTQKISVETVPKIEKKKSDGLYARTMANIMLPKAMKTPNMTEDLSGMLDEMIYLRSEHETDLASKKRP